MSAASDRDRKHDDNVRSRENRSASSTARRAPKTAQLSGCLFCFGTHGDTGRYRLVMPMILGAKSRSSDKIKSGFAILVGDFLTAQGR